MWAYCGWREREIGCAVCLGFVCGKDIINYIRVDAVSEAERGGSEFAIN